MRDPSLQRWSGTGPPNPQAFWDPQANSVYSGPPCTSCSNTGSVNYTANGSTVPPHCVEWSPCKTTTIGWTLSYAGKSLCIWRWFHRDRLFSCSLPQDLVMPPPKQQNPKCKKHFISFKGGVMLGYFTLLHLSEFWPNALLWPEKPTLKGNCGYSPQFRKT